MIIDKQNGNVAADKLDSNNVNKVCGIYKISNSKYFYIGLSIDIRNRWKQHLRALKKGVHKNIFIQRVYNKYKDLDPFEFSILCECDKKDLGIAVQFSGKQSGGFQWQKYEEYKINPKGKIFYDKEQPGYQYSINNDFIAKYDSIKHASEATNIKHCNISNTIHGKQKTAGGFIWKI